MMAADLLRRITLTLRLYAMTCGWLTLPRWTFLVGAEGTLHVPVPSYLIDHPKGKLLFDSGLHLATQTDSVGYLGTTRSKRLAIEFKAGDELAARLETMEVDVRDIRYLVNSHLHFDHVGGNAQIPNAALVIQRLEWQAGRDPDLIAAMGYQPSDYDLGHDVIEVVGEHDVFGDGTVVCLPTPGHTPGHQSLRVRLDGGEVVLAGDACYLRESLRDLHLPSFLHDEARLLASLRLLREFAARGARIFYGHDPRFWQGVPQAPAAVV